MDYGHCDRHLFILDLEGYTVNIYLHSIFFIFLLPKFSATMTNIAIVKIITPVSEIMGPSTTLLCEKSGDCVKALKLELKDMPF